MIEFRPLRAPALALAAATAIAALAAPASAQLTTVAPAGFAETDGSLNSDGPLGTTTDGTAGRRYQQIYDASLFGNFDGPRSITEIQFRAATTENAFRPNSITASDTRIQLSTTGVSATPGATADGNFSSSFPDNVGADAQTVYRGALTLDRGGSNPSGQPQPFSYGFALQTAFTYDPSMGNLLLDVVVPNGATVTAGPGFGGVESFDASVASGDGTASAFGTGGGPVGAAGQAGLVTQFTSSPAVIPEPTGLALAGVAAGWVGLRRRRGERA